MKPMLTFDEAERNLFSSVSPLPSIRMPVEEALGLHLVESLVASQPHPLADRSVMDGYAISGAEYDSWHIVGESAAGHPYNDNLATGEAVRISTGAIVPQGCDCVVPVEAVAVSANRISITVRSDNAFIRKAGSDFGAGDMLLEPGAIIDGRAIALAWAAGQSHVSVVRRPTAAILQVGDELVAGPTDDPSRYSAVNGPMVEALLSRYADVRPLPIAADDSTALAQTLDAATDCDLLITIGGASVGPHDLMRPALEHWGANIEFWRVAMKPGKPFFSGSRQATRIFGLPGNPASAFVTACLFVLPMLRRMGGARHWRTGWSGLELSEDLPVGCERCAFINAKIEHGGLVPLPSTDSGRLLPLARATHLIRREPFAPAAKPGSMVMATGLPV